MRGRAKGTVLGCWARTPISKLKGWSLFFSSFRIFDLMMMMFFETVFVCLLFLMFCLFVLCCAWFVCLFCLFCFFVCCLFVVVCLFVLYRAQCPCCAVPHSSFAASLCFASPALVWTVPLNQSHCRPSRWLQPKPKPPPPPRQSRRRTKTWREPRPSFSCKFRSPS